MQVTFTFRHLDTSDSLRAYAGEKLEHTVNKYLQSPMDAKVVFSVEKFWHIAQFSLKVRGLTIKSKEKSEDMYSSIDLALDKLERQLRRYKDKIRTRKVPGDVKNKEFNYQVISPSIDTEEAFEEEQEAAERGEYTPKESTPAPEEFGFMNVDLGEAGTKAGNPHVKVLRTSVATAPAMTLAEAIMQLDLLNGEDVLVFTRVETQTISILHRRRDGNYNLIES